MNNKNHVVRLVGVTLAFLMAVAQADIAVSPGNTSIQAVKGRLVTPDAVIDGAVVVTGDTITCVGTQCAIPAGATVFTVSDAYVFPGFIDAHNHVAYNALPKWKPPKLYQNRWEWQRASAYRAFKRPYDQLKRDGLECEMVKYGEVKALLSGVTTIQGSPRRTCLRMLIRNAENPEAELPVSDAHIRTYVPSIDSPRAPNNINWSDTKAFVVHLAEGADEPSRREFETLKAKRLLNANTVIIHGTAFGDTEFREMGAVGAKLVWSPRSNLVLYGKTTRIDLARSHGVPVSLGVDWNPTGSNDLFEELRTAAEVNQRDLGNVVAEGDWVRMVTSNPAQALALDDFIGSLQAGLKADITVVRAHAPTPGSSLLQSQVEDVQAVWVGGKLLYGDKAVVTAVRGTACEDMLVRGAPKQVCVRSTNARVPNGGQSLADIRRRLLQRFPGVVPLGE